MPPLTRWFIKTSFVYLGLGLAEGILLAGQSLWNSPLPYAILFQGYIHLLTVGWLTMLIFGVANWMFPRASFEHPDGSEALGLIAYLMLNLGLVMRLAGEPLVDLHPQGLWGWFLVSSAILQWLGGMIIIMNLWKRVKVK
jgi:hypothetical protein